MRVVFFRTPWMKDYNGITDDDVPVNGGSWVKENSDAHEAHNFTNCSGWVYGFVQPITLDIKRIDKNARDSVTNTLVIFFSTKPGGGQYIVGWYKNAEVFKNWGTIIHPKRETKYKEYHAKALFKDAHLVKVKDRRYELPVRPGEKNVWYGKDYLNKSQLADIIEYINAPESYWLKKSATTRKPKQYDKEKRQAVEHAAMDAVWDYYTLDGYTLNDVSASNLGWDLEAMKGKTKLTIEVKGLSGSDVIVELTPNEYSKFLEKRSNYRLAILINALTNKQKLYIFQYINELKDWIDLEENRISIKPINFARITLK